ncbi:hypothetical protein JHL17_34030 [Azospirillum sp. YIM B02556]|uniref:NYN domain-containing protein n=1 Tax=Azospirillum endophyticum TaxID=2800326 RepID=A0ABS1FG64_9PROT|nr:hypothetical protein [Azospirillum endophyticum]MBK1842426.1 hypothetical protein [Azospirillum endophyticum]
MIVIDLDTPILNNNRKFFALHSGQYREFIDIFREHDIVFLDIPGFIPPDGSISDDEFLKERVVRSRLLAKWYRAREKEAYPTTDLTYYSDTRQGRSVSAAMGNVRRLYHEAKRGDFVIVPGDGLFADVLIGMFTDDPDFENTVIVENYKKELIPYRSVRWLSNPFRTDITRELSEKLSRPRAITEISEEHLQAEILQLAFGNYVFGDSAKQYFAGESYDDRPYAPVPGLTLLSALLSSTNAVLNGQAEEIAELDVPELADHQLASEDVINFEINFASPGGFRVWVTNAVLALSLSALVSATGANISYAEALEAQITNSQAADDPCVVAVQESYRGVMEQLGIDRYNEMCRLNQNAQKSVGLKSGAKITSAATPKDGSSKKAKSKN